ncbi:MAG: aldehyde dehydrogenase family protein, partial [Pseudomonadota bacterium]
MRQVHSFAAGAWVPPGPGARAISSAITGQVIAEAGNDALDVQAMRAYARDVGGPSLRAMTFHERARMLKALALHLREHRQPLYDLSFDTGATQADHLIDVDGGIGTMLIFASKGRREMPDAQVYLDGSPEQLGRDGQFFGQHIYTPLQGVAVHINAFNFPVWGMLEKVAPTLLAGVPAIVKPATATSYVTEACLRLMIESGHLPDGAVQLVTGGVGDLLDYMDCQDVVTFTGSADTARTLRGHATLLNNAVRFTAEQDSLNASVLGPDAVPGTAEFDLFVNEVQREMTAKAGQKCTAIRR